MVDVCPVVTYRDRVLAQREQDREEPTVSRYELQDVGVGAFLGLVGLTVGVAAGCYVTESRHAADELAATTVASVSARPGCELVPAVDSRIALGSPHGWANVGYTSGCTVSDPVSLSLLDPSEREYRSVDLEGYSGVNGAVVALSDAVPIGKWTLRLKNAAPASWAMTEVKYASRLTYDPATAAARATVYDPVHHTFRPWATTLETQRLTPAGWRKVGATRTSVDGTTRVPRPAPPGRYRVVTFDTNVAFGSQVDLGQPVPADPGPGASVVRPGDADVTARGALGGRPAG